MSFPAVSKGETVVVTPTEEQEKALANAAAAQEKVAAAADAATAEEKAKEGKACKWYGLRPLEPLLASIDLIDAAYLIALGEAGGVVPRWQDVPAAARINAASVWRLRCWNGDFSLPVFVLSYPWLDRQHPDKHGATLRRILPILRACVEHAQKGVNSVTDKKFGSAHATVGVFWDYLSLPQRHVDGTDDRSAAERARFDRGLAQMAGLYAHPFTLVLSARIPIPDGDYENTRPYEKRGWCLFELRTASIVKCDKCLWDLSLHEEGTAITFKECCGLRSTRPPLTSPEQMARELREKKFTNDADIGVVASLYEQGFVRAFDTLLQYSNLSSIYYSNLGWGTAQVPTLVAALEYAETHCRPKDRWGRDAELTLCLTNNKFTAAEKAQLRAAIPEGSTKFGLKL